jgi:hypothetical protein
LVFTLGIEHILVKFWEESADSMREVMMEAGENCIKGNFTPNTGVITEDEMDRTCGTDE